VTGAELFFDGRAGFRFSSSNERNDEAKSDDPAGGARRDRTDDLLLAKQALSQLSYGPSREQGSEVSNQRARARASAFFLITDT
jgi:hypothetical protein